MLVSKINDTENLGHQSNRSVGRISAPVNCRLSVIAEGKCSVKL